MDVELVLDESIAPGIEDVAGPVERESGNWKKRLRTSKVYNDSSSLHYMHAGRFMLQLDRAPAAYSRACTWAR